MSERWYEGIRLGKHIVSGGNLVSLEDGRVGRARSIYERPTSVRLTMAMLDSIKGLTWKATSTISGAQPLDMRTPDGHQESNPEVIEAPERPPYRVHLTKAILEKVGYSARCKKCAAMKKNGKVKTQNLMHSDECRARVEAEMEKGPAMRRAVQGATDRQNEWLARRIEQADKNEDYWKEADGEIIRVHKTPRTELFTPSGEGCPVGVGDLSNRRRTVVKFASGHDELLGDDWTVPEDAHRPLEEEWTGETIFRREAPTESPGDDLGVVIDAGKSELTCCSYYDRRDRPVDVKLAVISSSKKELNSVIGSGGVSPNEPKYDVAELYSPSRLTRLAGKRGLRAV